MVHLIYPQLGKMRGEIYAKLEDNESSTETQGSLVSSCFQLRILVYS